MRGLISAVTSLHVQWRDQSGGISLAQVLEVGGNSSPPPKDKECTFLSFPVRLQNGHPFIQMKVAHWADNGLSNRKYTNVTLLLSN